MKAISVFCGSSTGNKSIYSDAAKNLGQFFALEQITLVYGAGNVGLMGIIADTCLAYGGKVIGVIPDFLKKREVFHTSLTELHVTQTMHERKQKMAAVSEGVIALPGGFGTLDELFDMATLGQLHQHNYPVGLLNINGYFDYLLQQINFMVAEGFVSSANQKMILVSNNLEDLIEQMNNYQPSVEDKWL